MVHKGKPVEPALYYEESGGAERKRRFCLKPVSVLFCTVSWCTSPCR